MAGTPAAATEVHEACLTLKQMENWDGMLPEEKARIRRTVESCEQCREAWKAYWLKYKC